MSSLTPLLDQVSTPEQLRQLDARDLAQLAQELRAETISAASQSGGHFGAGLGVVELTVALHYVFDTPRDRLIWDVSHQTYPHKILTDRRGGIRNIRQRGGLYGFTKRSESVYDPFGAAHSSTSISAGLGMAVARDHLNAGNHVVCVIGDGALSGGLAFEAINNAGVLGSRLTIVVNDNGMSIAPATGALSRHLSALQAGHAANNMFEALGCRYQGPIDGHDINALLTALTEARHSTMAGPAVIHVVTEKGRGHPFKAPDKEKYHAVGTFSLNSSQAAKASPAAITYTQVFADTLIEEAETDEKIVAITAGMPSGTGLDRFAERFPRRMFDTGIAEQHAVTFAAGLSTEGMKPFCTIYSTFLQRAYDQVVHDVALQGLPVRFAIDRAGLVGQDGATHAGSFDLTYLSQLPNMVVMAPSSAGELQRMVRFAAAYDDGPIAFRYPRGNAFVAELSQQEIELGKGTILGEGNDVALLCIGGRLEACLAAARELKAQGIAVTVADARFCKPLDHHLIDQLARHHPLLVTVEEGAVGGFASHVLQHLAHRDLLGRTRFRALTLPDAFIAHGTPNEQLADAGLDCAGISAAVLAALGHHRGEGRGHALHVVAARQVL